MNFIQKFINKYKDKIKIKNERCDDLIININKALQESKALFSNEQDFIEPGSITEWENKYRTLFVDVAIINIKKLKRTKKYSELFAKQIELYNTSNSIRNQLTYHNECAAKLRVQNAYALIGDVEGVQLDYQQMLSIVKESHSHLVIAGAGTGKTTTIVGKIKFLLKSGKYKPEDILVLSFTNASASEMSERINKETGCKIEASTFHKLGLNIITKVNGLVPNITQLNLHKYIKEQLYNNMKSDSYLSLLNSYIISNHAAAKSELEFSNEEEYREYLRLNPPITMNNENVKSYGEMEIANFLFQNGIKYIYECPYRKDTRTNEYGQYLPDFYLPDYDIYIEYFSINKDGEVPDYFKVIEGKQTYQEAITWKRDLHKNNGSIMIECYAYEKFEGNLIDSLKQKLIENSVKFNTLSSKEIWEHLSKNNDTALDGIIELFETIINLIKSNGYTIEILKELIINNVNYRNNYVLISLIEPIYNAYCLYLQDNNEIDFNDMINLATKYIIQGKYINPYKCVIVDEYQDISKSRYSLLEKLRSSNDFELFCVGDDWQSIYRFAGSDINFILNFEKYWGAAEVSKIETTYRFPQKLIEISGNFIMKNSLQIKKNIKGRLDKYEFPLGEIIGYNDRFAIEFMIQKLDSLPKGSSIFFLGRYSFDVKLLSDNNQLECNYNNISGLTEVIYWKRPDLKMNFITAHKSKGLQADYVFIINNKNSHMGFPSKIQDSPILNLLLDNSDSYSYAEERRLFYVALTRAKRKVILVTVNGKESEFVMELKDEYNEEIKREKFECPKCGGRLLKKVGQYGEFLGCSNYKNGCTYTRKMHANK